MIRVVNVWLPGAAPFLHCNSIHRLKYRRATETATGHCTTDHKELIFHSQGSSQTEGRGSENINQNLDEGAEREGDRKREKRETERERDR